MESVLKYHQGSVHAIIAFNRKRIYWNTKIKVPAKALDKKGFVKSSFAENASKMNEIILSKKKELDEAIRKDMLHNVIVDLDRVKNILKGVENFTSNAEEVIDTRLAILPDIFKRFFATLVKMNRGLKWRYETLYKILESYKQPCYKLETRDMVIIFETFIKGIGANTATTYFKNFKRFYNWALKKKYVLPELDYEAIRPKGYKADFIVLDEKKIEELWNYQPKSEHFKRVKTIFLILCYTGMRYSDYLRMRNEDIQNNHLMRVTKKTIEVISIPIHKRIAPIIKDAPKMASAVFNRSIKELGEDIGWKEMIRWRKSLTEFEMVPFYKKLKSHVGRHTAASRWLAEGITLDTIMLWTGWRESDIIIYYGVHHRKDTSLDMQKIK